MKCNRVVKGQVAVAAGLLLGGMGLLATVSAADDPTGIGDCALVDDPMTGMTVWMGHPCAQPHPGRSAQTGPEMVDGVPTWIVETQEGQHPPQDPFAEPPGSNFLLTVNENLRDLAGREMPNTLPSTPDNPYNLHDGPVLTRKIDPTNPEDDLDMIIDALEKNASQGGWVDEHLVDFAIDILEGNKLKGKFKKRAYSGLPMLHYNGPNKVKKVEPICANKNGKPGKKCKPGDTVIGGNVDVNLIYFNQHIEGDTAFVDPSLVQEVPWTITYHVNILNRGMEDFSPMVMNFNRLLVPDMENPGQMLDVRGPFHASMDQSYFPMLDEGTRYTVKIKENKGKYYNLTYIWGWRIHPPRVQVIENALKTAPPGVEGAATLVEHEKIAFCEGGRFDEDCDPVGDRQDKAYAIAQIGDLSPAKRMWNIFQSLKVDDDDDGHKGRHKGRHKGGHNPYHGDLAAIAADLREAFLDWQDRTRLPTGVNADPDATITLFYVNNTIYGSRQGMSGQGSELGPASFKGISNGAAHEWNIRPYLYKVTLLNGDHFQHGYMNVDFGGSRGWENHFQYTDPTTLPDPHGSHTEQTVIEGRRFTVEDNVLLDTTSNPGSQALRDFDYPEPHTVVSNDRIFPANTGGMEEFLEPSPRNPDDPVNGDPQLGSGCFFTFGRNHAWPNAGGPWGGIGVMPVMEDGTPGMAKVEITYNFEPTRRLRIYQFDPLHHDVAVYSLH